MNLGRSKFRSFLSGVASILDIGGSHDSQSYLDEESGFRADAEAVRSDFEAIGRDLQKAMDKRLDLTWKDESAP